MIIIISIFKWPQPLSLNWLLASNYRLNDNIINLVKNLVKINLKLIKLFSQPGKRPFIASHTIVFTSLSGFFEFV